MLKGLNLTLLIGPALPVPAPKEVINSIQSIQVTNSKERSGFQISFNVGKNSILLKNLLPAGYFDPIVTRVIIVVTLNGIPNVLMDGMVTNHELSTANEPGQSKLTITGEDLSLAMDLVELVIPYPALPEIAKVYSIIGRYAFLGITPVAIPPIASLIRNPTEGWESQPKMTDRAYLKYLADRYGYVFFVQPGPLPGQSIAYFGPDVNAPVPQPALSVNLDAASNVESLSFSLNGTAKKIRIFTVMDPFTKKIPIPLPIPNIDLFKPPLGLRPTPPAKIEYDKNAAKLQPGQAVADILGFLSKNSAAISANGTLDVTRYGSILRARMLVGVRGASTAYNGLYYVDNVTHNIEKGKYTQSFTLSRDGLISNTPYIPV